MLFFGPFVYGLLFDVVGVVIPLYLSYKAIIDGKSRQMQNLLMFWVLQATVTVFEIYGEIFISWLPLYNEAKIFILVYLTMPAFTFEGARICYMHSVEPLLVDNERHIDDRVESGRQWGLNKGIDMLKSVSSSIMSRADDITSKAQTLHPALGMIAPSLASTASAKVNELTAKAEEMKAEEMQIDASDSGRKAIFAEDSCEAKTPQANSTEGSLFKETEPGVYCPVDDEMGISDGAKYSQGDSHPVRRSTRIQKKMPDASRKDDYVVSPSACKMEDEDADNRDADFVELMNEGVKVVKYGKGQVKRRVLKMVGTGRKAKVIWFSTTKAKSPSRAGLSTGLSVLEIENVYAGKETPVFADWDADEARCFSLVTNDKSLDLQVADEKMRDLLVYGFRRLKEQI